MVHSTMVNWWGQEEIKKQRAKLEKILFKA